MFRPLDGKPVELPYDHLILALGSVSRALPIPGLAEHAIGFKTLPEAIEMRNRLLRTLEVGPAPDGSRPPLLFCENETNRARIDGVPSLTPFPKDGINDHVVSGASTVNPAETGTKAAAWYQVTVPL